MTDVTEVVGEGLHAAAILGDGGVEIMAEEDRPGLPVGAEEALNGEPEVPGGLVVVSHGEVEDGVVDGAEEPGADAAVRLIPSRILGRGAIVPSICNRKPNLPHNYLKYDAHLE